MVAQKNNLVKNKKLSLILLLLLTLAILFDKSEESQLDNPKNNFIPVESKTSYAKVTRVIDGDTIEIEGGQRVRYIGINSPEKQKCFFEAAANKNKELVENKVVKLEKDVSQTDKYGRLLRYVHVKDELVNNTLVEQGYASVFTYPPDVKYKDLFLKSQAKARTGQVGLWQACK